MAGSTKRQRQKIGFLRKRLGLDEDIYRELLLERTGFKKSKDISSSQAKSFITYLENKATEMGLFLPKKEYYWQKNKYGNDDRDENAATAKQLRKIEAMWFDVSTQNDDKSREQALNKFIKRITGKDHIKFLLKTDIPQLINALKTMKETKNDKCSNKPN